MITRFISGAYRCDAQTSDGRYIRIEYITPQEEDSAEVLDEEVLQGTHNGSGMGSFVAGAEDSVSQGSDQASSDQKYVLERQQSWTTQEPDDDLLDEQYQAARLDLYQQGAMQPNGSMDEGFELVI